MNCLVCDHPERRLIEEALRTRRPYVEIRELFAVPDQGLFGHNEHGDAPSLDSPLSATAPDWYRQIRWATWRIAVRAEADKDPRTALAAIRRIEAQLPLAAKIDEFQLKLLAAKEPDYSNDPAWLDCRARIVAALQPFPAALQALMGALRDA